LRVLLALVAVTLVLAYLQKSPCADGAWTGSKQYTHACYSDVLPLWSAEHLDTGAVPYRDQAVEYPVLTGGFMWLTAGITHGVSGAIKSISPVQLFGIVTAFLLAACGLLVAAGTAGASRRRPYDAAIFALSPLLVFHAFSNWDLLAMAFTSCALWAWARSRPVAAGVLIALGTSAKLYPVLLLVPIVLLALRTARVREAAWAVVSATFAWLAVNLPIAIAYPHGWSEFYRFSADRVAEASTFWYMGHYLRTVGWFGPGYDSGWKPPGYAVALLCVGAVGVVFALGALAPARPRMGQLVFLVVLAFLLSTKVWSPQYSLWLVPLVALARPRWRITLLWQFSEIMVWIMTLLWLLGGDSHGIDYGWLMITLLVRDGFLVAIAVLVVREMWHPERDAVRAAGFDDPCGGPFDGAPDRPWRQWQSELDRWAAPGDFAGPPGGAADDGADDAARREIWAQPAVG